LSAHFIMSKKKQTPIDVTIDPEEFKRMGQELDQQAASVMRMVAGLGFDDRMTPDSVEKFLAKKGI